MDKVNIECDCKIVSKFEENGKIFAVAEVTDSAKGGLSINKLKEKLETAVENKLVEEVLKVATDALL